MATREQMSSQKIDNIIATVKSHLANFNDTVQEGAVAIIEHASMYGDCSRAKILARAVPSRLRNMLVGYFRLYSPIGVTIGKTAADDKNRFVTDEALSSFRERARLLGNNDQIIDTSKWPKFHIEGAKANKWYEDPARVAPEPKPLDGLKEFWDRTETFLDRLLTQADLNNENHKFREEDIPLIREAIVDLKAMVNRYHVKQQAALLANEPGEPEEQGVVGSPNNVVEGPKPRSAPRRSTAQIKGRGRKAHAA